MSNLKRDIEELLKEVRKWRYEAPGQSVDINTLIKAERKMYKQATTQIINLIESVVGEIIGEDEKEMVLVESEITVAKEHGYRTKIEKSEWFDEKIHARNKLRKEQRDIKSKLIGGSNGKE